MGVEESTTATAPCRYYNRRLGCTDGDCTFDHVCDTCGGNHPAYSVKKCPDVLVFAMKQIRGGRHPFADKALGDAFSVGKAGNRGLTEHQAKTQRGLVKKELEKLRAQ